LPNNSLELASDLFPQRGILASRPKAWPSRPSFGLEALDVKRFWEKFMYASRDGDTRVHELHQELDHGKEDAIRTILEKTPMGEYLAHGLILAQRNFINLEGPW
jgi:hypothetical protein